MGTGWEVRGTTPVPSTVAGHLVARPGKHLTCSEDNGSQHRRRLPDRSFGSLLRRDFGRYTDPLASTLPDSLWPR